jgi:hypothetical protein
VEPPHTAEIVGHPSGTRRSIVVGRHAPALVAPPHTAEVVGHPSGLEPGPVVPAHMAEGDVEANFADLTLSREELSLLLDAAEVVARATDDGLHINVLDDQIEVTRRYLADQSHHIAAPIPIEEVMDREDFLLLLDAAAVGTDESSEQLSEVEIAAKTLVEKLMGNMYRVRSSSCGSSSGGSEASGGVRGEKRKAAAESESSDSETQEPLFEKSPDSGQVSCNICAKKKAKSHLFANEHSFKKHYVEVHLRLYDLQSPFKCPHAQMAKDKNTGQYKPTGSPHHCASVTNTVSSKEHHLRIVHDLWECRDSRGGGCSQIMPMSQKPAHLLVCTNKPQTKKSKTRE